MAKLVRVCRADNYDLQRRQFPLLMDDTFELIVQFPDVCTNCRSSKVDEKEINNFTKKFRSLQMEDLMQSTVLSKQFLITQLSHSVQCIGCRRSVEKLIEEFAKVSHRAMEPMSVSHFGSVSILQEYFTDPKSIYSVLYDQSSCHAMDVSSRSRKGRRCVLHSVDAHKSKALWSCQDILDLASSECQEELLLIDFDSLHNTLEDYLRKHRFCSDCKNKVANAYRILVKEIDGMTEKDFCPSLYEGIKVCEKERHLHVSCDEKFIKALIERAEPELAGNQREQHAKTLDVAQEEVLTCLGIHLQERFMRLLQRLKVKEKSWLILYNLSLEAFRKNIEMAFEKKLDRYNVDNIVAALVNEGEQPRTPIKQSRRRKKKCKKIENGNVSPAYCGGKADKEAVVTETNEAQKLSSCLEFGLGSQDSNHNIILPTSPYPCQCITGLCQRIPPPSPPQMDFSDLNHCNPIAEVCISCDSHHSAKAVSERCCTSSTHTQHTVDVPLVCSCSLLGISCVQCHQLSSQTFSSHLNSKIGNNGRDASNVNEEVSTSSGWNFCNGFSRYTSSLSLQEMLKIPRSSDDEDSCEIGEEEILQFKANEQHVMSERQQLRQVLRQRFATMQQRCICPKTREYATTCSVNVVCTKIHGISTE